MFAKQKLKDNFILPKKPKMGYDGRCRIQFSGNVKFLSIEETIINLSKLIKKKNRLLRGLQDEAEPEEEAKQEAEIKVDPDELLPVFT